MLIFISFLFPGHQCFVKLSFTFSTGLLIAGCSFVFWSSRWILNCLDIFQLFYAQNYYFSSEDLGEYWAVMVTSPGSPDETLARLAIARLNPGAVMMMEERAREREEWGNKLSARWWNKFNETFLITKMRLSQDSQSPVWILLPRWRGEK